MNPYQREQDDDRVVADMSEVSRTPMLMPRFDSPRKERRDISADPDAKSDVYHAPVQLDREERRAMIGGAVSAALLIGGTIAVAFAALILFILKVYG